MIRRMELGDVPAVHTLETECFSMPWSEQSLRDAIQNPDTLFFVLEDMDGTVIGYMGMYIVAGEADVTNIAITNAKRGQGYGRALLDYVIEYTTQKGILEMTLEVRSSNKVAIHLYEQAGFRTEGIRKNFYNFPKEDACIMWRRENTSI